MNRRITDDSCKHSICYKCFKIIVNQENECTECGQCFVCQQTCNFCRTNDDAQKCSQSDDDEEENDLIRSGIVEETFSHSHVESNKYNSEKVCFNNFFKIDVLLRDYSIFVIIFITKQKIHYYQRFKLGKRKFNQ